MDMGLMPEEVGPRPDVYVLAGTDAGAAEVAPLVAKLRRAGLHARMSYKTSRNLGKLLKDAAASRARHAVIVDDQIAQGVVGLKNLATGEQANVDVAHLAERLRG
jgi:histidyl-tRNA synthetase